MDNKHITRDYSAHKQSIIRPNGEYVKLEVFSYKHNLTKYFLAEDNSIKSYKNAVKTSWKSWSCYKYKKPSSTTSSDSNDMVFNIPFNAIEDGEYRIDVIYEKSNHIFGSNEKSLNTGKNLAGNITITKGKNTVYNKNHKYYGHNNVIKRIPIFQKLNKGSHTIKINIPHNCYFMGVIVRRVITLVGDNFYGDSLGSEEGSLMLTTASFTNSDITKPSELTVEIGYDDALECEYSASGFYIDYMDEVNFYVKDNDNKIQRIFGGYVSSILPDANRTKLTIACADRLIDGQNKYVLDQMVMNGGTKKQSEDEYSSYMTKNFNTYPQALLYLCQIHETTLNSNISSDYTVDGEKFHNGIVLAYGSSKKIKKIKAYNGKTKESKNYIMVRNNSSSAKKQVFTLYDARNYTKKPLEFTNYPYLHITYGLGDPMTTYDTKITETVDVTSTTAGTQKFGKCGVSQDGKYVMAIGTTSSAKDEGSYGTYYKTIFVNKCPHCGKATLRWDSCRSDTKCIYTQNWNGSKGSWGVAPIETEITCNSCDSDFSAQGIEKDSPWAKLTKVSKTVKSSLAEQNKLHRGEMTAIPKTGENISSDDIFKAITKEAFKYQYVLYGETYQTYTDMKKHGKGDCWGFSDLIFTMLSKYGVKCKIVQYGTSQSDAHRSVLYVNGNGQWVDFPYREYGWGTRYNNNLNNTDSSKSGSIIKINKSGSKISDIKTTSTSTTKKQTTTIKNSVGYDKSKPFQGFLKITYSLQQSFNAKKYSLYVKFTQNVNNYSISLNTGLSLYWINNTIKKSSLDKNITDYLRILHHNENARFYLHSIHFITPIVKATSVNKDVNWYKLDATTNDNSSCKMNLYQITFNDMKGVEASELNSCGKSINTVMGEVINEAGYNVNMTYGTHRKDDRINFRVVNQTSESFTASEGDNNNILSWNSISYSPLSKLFNISLQVFKNGQVYNYIETKDTKSIFQYGEQTTLQTSNDSISIKEAYYNATKSDKLNPSQSYSYTITVPNYPNLKIGDLVKVVANAKNLNDVKEVKSIKISFEHDKMPRIRTEIGLDELAPDIQLKKNIRNLKANTKKESTYFSSTADPVTDEIYYEWDR